MADRDGSQSSTANGVVAYDAGELITRRVDRLETVFSEALKDINTKLGLIVAGLSDVRDEVDRLGRDLISTRATVAAVDVVAMKRRKARK